jgi:hypothetical protein
MNPQEILSGEPFGSRLVNRTVTSVFRKENHLLRRLRGVLWGYYFTMERNPSPPARIARLLTLLFLSRDNSGQSGQARKYVAARRPES